jgi:O-antigen/teichoic acid export membrane protein
MYHSVEKARKRGLEYAGQIMAAVRSPLFKNFCIYSFGALVLRMSSLALTPLTLTLISPEEFGLLALANSFINIVAVLVGLGLRQVLSLEFFHCTSARRREMANDMIVIYLCISVPFFTLLLCGHAWLKSALFASNVSDSFVVLIIASCFISFFVELFYQLLRYQCKAYALTMLQLTAACITLSCTVILLYVYRWGLYAVLVGNGMGMLYVFGRALHAYVRAGCWPLLAVRQSAKRMGYYVRYGAPFIPTVLFGWLLASGDRWILAHYASLHEVGIYSLADAFGQCYMMLILYPMSGSYLPYVMHAYAHNPNTIPAVERWNLKNMYLSMAVAACAITLCCGLGARLLTVILPVHYHEAIGYIWFVLMGYVFLMGTYFASALIQFYKKTSVLLITLAMPALLNLALTLLLVPRFTLFGCVLATFISYVVYFIIVVGYNYRLQRECAREYAQ